MELEDLDELFEDLDTNVLLREQLHRIYGIYLNDFVYSDLFFEGKKIVVNTDIVRNKRDGYFVSKQKSFDHIVTRENKYSGKRQYDKDRANRIHWIKVIIENYQNPLIKVFEKIDKNGDRNILLWYEGRSYVVILREKLPNMFLVTGYCVDAIEQGRFRNEYKIYKNKKTSLRK